MPNFVKFGTTSPEGMPVEAVLKVNAIIGVEVSPDNGTIVVDGGLIYKTTRGAALDIQAVLLSEDN